MSVIKRGVGVYIFNQENTKIFLTQRGPDARHGHFRWEGPGGALEVDETYEQAAYREIKEELDISIELGEVIAEFEAATDCNGDVWEAKAFRASTNEVPHIMEPTKCVGFGWFDKTEISKLSLTDYAVNDLRQFGWL